MKTIVLAATKGGTGKTTLAFNIGIEAAKHGTVYLADLDPQKSLKNLCERRGQDEQGKLIPDDPLFLDNVETITGAVTALGRSGGRFSRDFLIVDTPGSFMKIIREAIGAADCIVLPVQPSPLDVAAQEDVARVIAELGKSDKAIFVLNRVDARASSLTRETLLHLGKMIPESPIRPVEVRQRTDFVRAASTGRTGAELNGEARAEIAELWKAIEKVLKHEEIRPGRGAAKHSARESGRGRSAGAEGS
jgi:chromosome partitioning protein